MSKELMFVDKVKIVVDPTKDYKEIIFSNDEDSSGNQAVDAQDECVQIVSNDNVVDEEVEHLRL